MFFCNGRKITNRQVLEELYEQRNAFSSLENVTEKRVEENKSSDRSAPLYVFELGELVKIQKYTTEKTNKQQEF